MKKAFSVFLCLAVALSALILPSAHALTDVGADLEQKIGVLQMLGVISGYPDGSFRPGKSLTRAEFCKMAVYLLGKQDEADLEKSFTIFPDVKSSHWACGYINLSVKKLKLITGFPDGTFRPDETITYAQAVTILTKALGYNDADVGLNWPYSYINKAASIGLTEGLSAHSPNSPITRGSGAVLFYNMLNAQTKAGTKFLSTIGVVQENAIILDNDAVAADGTGGAVLIRGASSPIKSRNPIPNSYVGLRGTIIFDDSGWIKAFIPVFSGRRTFVLSESSYPRLISDGGESFALNDSTPVFMDGTEDTFKNVWAKLMPGTIIDIHLTAAGAVDYALVTSSSSQSSSTVVLSGTPTQAALEAMFGAKPGGVIYKNGVRSTVNDLAKYDVVTYNKAANTYLVSDAKVTGAYEFAYPNKVTPSKIKILNTEFEVTDSAVSQLSKFDIGDVITVLFTSDMRIAGAVSREELRVSAEGFYDGTGIQIINGPKLNVKPTASGIKAGSLVTVYSYRIGEADVASIRDTYPNVAVDLNNNKAGDKAIAANAKFYEKVGATGALVPIEKSDIAMALIPANRVTYLGYDSAGRVNTVVLNDVTGDLYEYGRVRYSTKDEDPNSPDSYIDVAGYVVVVNSKGSSDRYTCPDAMSQTDFWGGVYAEYVPESNTYSNYVRKYIILKQYRNLTRQSFAEGRRMLLDGAYVQIADEVHVYHEPSKSFYNVGDYGSIDEMLAAARANGSTFEAYTDKAPTEGGKVRIIVIK